MHKHRFGSCRGTLIATPAGIRDQTTNDDDRFSAGLLDLETFQVDYLEKNLRVQPRNGRWYDFTDPDGNADRLFVFDRDVERARTARAGTPSGWPLIFPGAGHSHLIIAAEDVHAARTT